MTPTITGRSTVDELPGPDGRSPMSGDRASTGRLGDRVFGGLAKGAGILVVGIVALVGTFLVIQAVPALLNNNVNFLTSREWVPSGAEPRFGILDMFWATTVTSIIAMVIAVPLGVAVALFLTQYAPPWLSGPAAATIDLLAAVPSIVYGFWGLTIAGQYFTPIQQGLSKVFGWIPVLRGRRVQRQEHPGLRRHHPRDHGAADHHRDLPRGVPQVPTAHKEGALALGATHWEMIRTAVLPFGKPGIISASMLGLGRALGETLAVVILLSGLNSTAGWNWSVFNGGSTFASKIAGGASEFDSPQKTGAYIAAGLVLFVLTFAVNAIARIVIERRKAFTE